MGVILAFIFIVMVYVALGIVIVFYSMGVAQLGANEYRRYKRVREYRRAEEEKNGVVVEAEYRVVGAAIPRSVPVKAPMTTKKKLTIGGVALGVAGVVLGALLS